MVDKRLALCNQAGRGHLAVCQVSLSADGKPPEWVQLVPAGKDVPAIDGRKWSNTNPQRIIDAFEAYPLDLPLDWEHASELKAGKGDEAPAAGWITDMQLREGSVWGKVEWTPRGTASLTAREYRFISPAFMHSPEGEIQEIVSAGLTNKPALTQLAAVASAEPTHQKQEIPIMDKETLKLLGLAEGATPEQIASAVKALCESKAKVDVELARAQTPDLSKFVPRPDYEAVLARATAAEKSIADEKAASLKKEVDTEIDAALKAGKITPPTVDYHRATCMQEGGLEKFRNYVKASPVIAAPSNLEGKPVPGSADGQPTATEQELAIARTCGLTPEKYLASKKSLAQATR